MDFSRPLHVCRNLQTQVLKGSGMIAAVDYIYI